MLLLMVKLLVVLKFQL